MKPAKAACRELGPRGIHRRRVPVDGGMTAHGGVTSISDAVRAATP